MSAALTEIAKLMERRAVDDGDQFTFEVSQLLIDTVATHEESVQDCPSPHHGDETGADYACPDYARAVQIGLSWSVARLKAPTDTASTPSVVPPNTGRRLSAVPSESGEARDQATHRLVQKGLIDYQDGFRRAWSETGEEMPHNWRAHIAMLQVNEVLLDDLWHAIDTVGALCCPECRFARVIENTVADLGDLAKFDLPRHRGGDAG